MGKLMLRELLRQGVQVDLYLGIDQTAALPVEPTQGLRIIVRNSGWRWGRWYSRNKPMALFTSLAARSLTSLLLSIRLLIEHRRRPYDAVYQLSQTELFLLGRVRRLAPPIVVHPCTHAAGELRWHQAEQHYALQSERRSVHMLMRGLLTVRSRLQPRELARADLVLGLSERFNEHLQEDYGVPPEKLGVVRTPVDLERFSPEGLDTDRHPRTLLFISRISTRKGVEEVIELSHRLADLAGSVRLLVVGGPTQWSDYRRHLARLNSAVAEYVGGVPNEGLPALLRSATMLIVPSRYEPGSIATAEALACGLPVVLSDEVGNSEVVAGLHARFHRAGDVDGLEAAVRSLLQSVEEDEHATRSSARANAEAEFAVEGVISRLIALISSLVPSSRAPAFAPATLDAPDVTICICTRGRPEDLTRTLASIAASTYPAAQVVVSDDGQDAVTEAVCRDATVEVDYILGPQRGLGSNRNNAADASTGDLILFIDDDCLLGHDFLETAIACMRSAERLYGAGRVIVSGRELNRGVLVSAADQTFLGFQSKLYTNTEGLRSICINATLFPAGLFSRVRFDPQLIYGYEEVDLASRAAARGYVIVQCENAINDHRPSPRSREDYNRYIDASRLHVTLRRYALTERAPLRALAFALIAPIHVLAADVKRLGLAGAQRTVLTLGLTATMMWRARDAAVAGLEESRGY